MVGKLKARSPDHIFDSFNFHRIIFASNFSPCRAAGPGSFLATATGTEQIRTLAKSMITLKFSCTRIFRAHQTPATPDTVVAVVAAEREREEHYLRGTLSARFHDSFRAHFDVVPTWKVARGRNHAGCARKNFLRVRFVVFSRLNMDFTLYVTRLCLHPPLTLSLSLSLFLSSPPGTIL